MKSHKVKGGGDVELHVAETGDPDGTPILFIHGFSQCWLTWSRQLDSDLARDYRLVAMDLRGHGLSEIPREGYTDSKLWADDVNAVIETLGLKRPVLSGWSYGPLAMLDYVRFYGEEAISGMQFVGGVSKLGSEEAASLLTPEFLALIPGFFSSDVEEAVNSLRSLIQLCFLNGPSPEALYTMLGFAASVPPYVRQGLFSRTFDNDDLLPTLTKPVLITHGASDRIVKLLAAEQHQSRIPTAMLQIIDNAGHGPFWDDAVTFNDQLRAFVERCAESTTQSVAG